MPSTIQLKDGRRLAYAEYGQSDGKPVFFFHGIPGSRVFRPPDEVTQKMGVRLITSDRPGFGLSDFQPGRGYLDWPEDILQLADALRIEKFSMAGHSGGGPFVAACAYKIPERITRAAILAGVGPADAPEVTRPMKGLNKIAFLTGRFIPWPVLRWIVWLLYRQGGEHPEVVMERDADRRPPTDAALWTQPGVREVCYASTAEAFRHGTRGFAWEVRLLIRPWDFRLDQIRIPVHLWHGSADNDAPISMARYLARTIPNSQAFFYEGEGHLLLFPHWEEILTVLTQT